MLEILTNIPWLIVIIQSLHIFYLFCLICVTLAIYGAVRKGGALERCTIILAIAGVPWLWSNIRVGLVYFFLLIIAMSGNTKPNEDTRDIYYRVGCAFQSIVGVVWLLSPHKEQLLTDGPWLITQSTYMGYLCLLICLTVVIIGSMITKGSILERCNIILVVASVPWLWSNMVIGLVYFVLFSIVWTNDETKEGTNSIVCRVGSVFQSIVGVIWLLSPHKEPLLATGLWLLILSAHMFYIFCLLFVTFINIDRVITKGSILKRYSRISGIARVPLLRSNMGVALVYLFLWAIPVFILDYVKEDVRIKICRVGCVIQSILGVLWWFWSLKELLLTNGSWRIIQSFHMFYLFILIYVTVIIIGWMIKKGSILEHCDIILVLAGVPWLWTNMVVGLVYLVLFSVVWTNNKTKEDNKGIICKVGCVIQSIMGVLWLLWPNKELLLTTGLWLIILSAHMFYIFGLIFVTLITIDRVITNRSIFKRYNILSGIAGVPWLWSNMGIALVYLFLGIIPIFILDYVKEDDRIKICRVGCEFQSIVGVLWLLWSHREHLPYLVLYAFNAGCIWFFCCMCHSCCSRLSFYWSHCYAVCFSVSTTEIEISSDNGVSEVQITSTTTTCHSPGVITIGQNVNHGGEQVIGNVEIAQDFSKMNNTPGRDIIFNTIIHQVAGRRNVMSDTLTNL